MAEILLEHDFRRQSKHPWAEWSDGRIWRATRIKDFTCSIESFRSLLRSHAQRYDLAVSIQCKKDTVIFQFVKKDDSAA